MNYTAIKPTPLIVVLAVVLNAVCRGQGGSPIPTVREPVTNVYHGVAVVDDYQWLEASTPRVQAWTAEQNRITRAYLDRLPVRTQMAEELEQMNQEGSPALFDLRPRDGGVFAQYYLPGQQQTTLIHFPSVDRLYPRRTILDPNLLNTNGTTRIDWWVPSRDGKLVAVSLSASGTEDGSLHFYDVAARRELGEVIPRVQFPTAGGSAAWAPNARGIFYTRLPHKGERPDADLNFYQQVWYHEMGTAVFGDRYEIGREFPKTAEIDLFASNDGRHLLARVDSGTGGDCAFWLRDQATAVWRQLTRFEDQVKAIAFGQDDAFYLLSRKGAPCGQVLRLPVAATTVGEAKVAIPEGNGTIQAVECAASGLYVLDLLGGPSRLRFFKNGTRTVVTVPIPPVARVFDLQCPDGDEAWFFHQSYLGPEALFRYRPGDREPRPTRIRYTSVVTFDDVELTREFVRSKDGTKIPLSILSRKGTRRNGSNATLLSGYGGYGVSQTPSMREAWRLWFDAGGIIAESNLRGGGEYGEAWHQAGKLLNKQNVFDDFIACAEHLIARRYTSPAKLAVQGTSNGGLLIGALLTQRPELVRAAVVEVGIFDMLRFELEPNGEFNVTEFGSVKDPRQFQALHAYSPYHHVRDDVAYPAVLLVTGENDGRVSPGHSRKMAARLQAANRTTRPILLRVSSASGHYAGSASEGVQRQADVYAFLFDQLGMDVSGWLSE